MSDNIGERRIRKLDFWKETRKTNYLGTYAFLLLQSIVIVTKYYLVGARKYSVPTCLVLLILRAGGNLVSLTNKNNAVTLFS